ncbi:MAG TPA: PHP domain-containing protein [Fibrobacteria bacterium]|nr:PHP domain-containing protein [Fibrobacteria bacterium]
MATLKLDFHLHTIDDPLDHHVYHTVFELLDKAAFLGYGVLAITLHDAVFESRQASDYAAERGILLLPGVERDIEGGHVLLINYPRSVIQRIHTFADLRREKREDGLTIAAHPYFPGGSSVFENLVKHRDVFDAVEISGFYHRRWDPNRKAREAARNLGLPLVGNSDTHTLEQFGTTWSEVDCGQDAASVIRAVKEGRVRVRTRSLAAAELGVIAYKVIARGYMKWIDYKRRRGYQSVS